MNVNAAGIMLLQQSSDLLQWHDANYIEIIMYNEQNENVEKAVAVC